MLTFAAVILAPHGLRHHGYQVQACTEREAEEGHNTLWVNTLGANCASSCYVKSGKLHNSYKMGSVSATLYRRGVAVSLSFSYRFTRASHKKT